MARNTWYVCARGLYLVRFCGSPPIAERRARDALLWLKETVADKPVVPVVRISDFKLVLAFAHSARDIGFPRRAPDYAAVYAIDEDVGKARGKLAEGEGECGIVKLWKYGIVEI